MIVCAAMGLLFAGCGSKTPTDPSQVAIEFSVVDLVVGTGTQAASGNSVNVNYTLWLYDPAGPDKKGVQKDAGTFPFVLGSNASIPGFEQGIIGMRVGGKRRIYVPSELAYGSQGFPPDIPPNAALVFEVELLQVQ